MTSQAHEAARRPGQRGLRGLEFATPAAYVDANRFRAVPCGPGDVTRFADMGEMPLANPIQFINQTRAEIGKVHWPSRREVLLTTVMVFIMATLTAIFFALVDLLIRSGLQGLLGFFG